MDEQTLHQLLTSLSRLLRPHLERSEPLRDLVRIAGQWLAEEADRAGRPGDLPAPPQASASVAPTPAVDPAPAPAPAPAIPSSATLTPQVTLSAPVKHLSKGFVPLRLGDSTIQVPVPGTTEEIGRARAAGMPVEAESPPLDAAPPSRRGGGVDLELVQARCRLKAESCRVYIARRAATGDLLRELPLIERLNDMVSQAKSMRECFLWVFYRERPQPDDDALRIIAECYEALADAAALLWRVTTAPSVDRGTMTEAFQLAAEANSALRIALRETWLTAPDRDQSEAHEWLRWETTVRQIFIERYMRIEDPADPDLIADTRQRIAAAARDLDTRLQFTKQVDAALKRVRWHADKVRQSDADERLHHFRKIADSITELAELRVLPEDRRLIEAIGMEVAESVPDELAAAPLVARAVAATRAWEEEEAQAESAANGSPRLYSQRVHEVREMLQGRSAVMIGGEPRPPAAERLKIAFGLKDVRWVRLSEHGSGDPMRAPIAQPDTAVVLILVKLTGHLHAEEAAEQARAAGKPVVYIKAGYNPERVAEAILTQAALRLQRGHEVG